MFIVLIAGPLGSGKTTLLLKLADKFHRTGKRVGILENDAGQIPVDASFLSERGYSVADIPSGCICCDLSAKLPQSIKFLRESANPDILFIEPSGLAAPGIVLKALEGLLQRDDRIICLYMADLLRFTQNKTLMTNPFFTRSMETAHIILYSKSTMISPAIKNEFLRYTQKIGLKVPVLDSSEFEFNNPDDLLRIMERNISLNHKASEEALNQSKPSVSRLGVLYKMEWKPVVSVEESKQWLVSLVSELRDSIIKQTESTVGTIKIYTKEGMGSIISVSDSRSVPHINQESIWERRPETIALNVLTYGSEICLTKILAEVLTRLKKSLTSIEACEDNAEELETAG